MTSRSPKLLIVCSVAIAVVTLLAAWALIELDHKDRRVADNSNADALRSAVSSFSGQTTVRVLDLAKAMETVEADDRRRAFANLSRLVLDDPAISTVSFMQRVSDRADYERTRHRIVSLDARRAAKASVYFPVDQRFSNFKLTQPLGIDLYGAADRRGQIDEAIDAGRPIATAPVVLMSGKQGISVFVPVYDAAMPTRTIAQRNAAVVGVVNASMRTATIEQTVRELAPALRGFTISDGSESVAAWGDRSSLGPSRAVQHDGREWTVRAAATASQAQLRVTIAFAIGFALIAFAVFLFLMARHRDHRERELRHQADHDELTGLANRRSFERALAQHLVDPRQSGRGALLIIDLDGLKQVNDGIGHAAGDAMIVSAATRIRERLRDTDVTARLGGDEFAALLRDVDREMALQTAQSLLESLHSPTPQLQAFGIEGVSASIGVAMVDDAASAVELMELADQAMYRAKRGGRDRVAIDEPVAH